MRKVVIAGVAALMAAPVLVAVPGLLATSALADAEFGVLKIAPGVEETYLNCTACHSERIVAQQGMTRDRWADLFEWMWDEQGMHDIPPEEVDTILDYLAEHYNEDRPNFPR